MAEPKATRRDYQREIRRARELEDLEAEETVGAFTREELERFQLRFEQAIAKEVRGPPKQR